MVNIEVCAIQRRRVAYFPSRSTKPPQNFTLKSDALLFNIAVPEAEKFDGFLSVSEGIPGLISKRDLGFSHDFTPTQPSTLSSGVSAVPRSHRNPGKYA